MADEQKVFDEAAMEKIPEGKSAEAAGSTAAELSPEELDKISGGNQNEPGGPAPNCPVYGSEGHKYEFTGESRATDAWFYKTEEHYKCACGKGYWSAGLFSITKWDE